MSTPPPDPGASLLRSLSDTGTPLPDPSVIDATLPRDAPVLPDVDSLSAIAWRRRLLLLVVVACCLGVFLLARLMALAPDVPAEWRVTPAGDVELASSELPELRAHLGKKLTGIRTPSGAPWPVDGSTLAYSARWLADDQARNELVRTRQLLTDQLARGQLTLMLDGAPVLVQAQPRGYLGLGAMFWLMSGFAVVLFLVGWIVPLVQPQQRSLLYAVMAHAQGGQLLMVAVMSVPALAPPAGLLQHEALLRTLLDLVTGAAIVHSATLHPSPVHWRHAAAGLCWAAALAHATLMVAGLLPHPWWWAQALLLINGLLCFALLTRAYDAQPHPFVLVMRRFCVITTVMLTLLTMAVALLPLLPVELRPVAAVGPVIWSVFFASVIMLVPFIARSRNVIREFAMLAGVSTLATSVDLLFVAVFSLSQFTSLTLSLFLALGTYAAVRQWLLNQMVGARVLTTERVFQHLYRVAREVEARPERAADCLIELLGKVFEPLETLRTEGSSRQSHIMNNGAVLSVPLPRLTDTPGVEGLAVLRFAERGKRLFTLDDARLADRIVEQFMRALAHDRAVERGRTEERTRIAQDLHDDIGARLLTLMYKATDKEMEDYVRHTLQDLKTLTRGLASRQHALSLALAEWKTDIAHRLDAAQCELSWESSFDEDMTLSVVQWSSLTRILRELVSNAIAHSQARHVSICCKLAQGCFVLTVSDDGIGRDPGKWSHGLGLGGIRKRVKLLGGTVIWRERPGHGICCTVTIAQLGTSTL